MSRHILRSYFKFNKMSDFVFDEQKCKYVYIKNSMNLFKSQTIKNYLVKVPT